LPTTKRIYIFLGLLLACISGVMAQANDRIYRLEVGIDGGGCYYVGDANRTIFKNVRETYGASFRYMFDRRWSVRAKGMYEHITGFYPDAYGVANASLGRWNNRLTNIDAVGEFNFLPFGDVRYDSRISPITPYIGIGIGVSLHGNFKKVAAYMPFIIGAKWRCAKHLTIHLAWQHNVYFSDGMENVEAYNNSYNLNGGNIMNMDVTGSLVLGFAVAFVQDGKVCRTCK